MAKNDKCIVDICTRVVGLKGAKGYCPMHYTRYRKYGDPNMKKSGGVKKVHATCSVDGCVSDVLQKSLCPRHYMKWYRHDDPEYEVSHRGRTRTVVSWSSMKQRCSNKNAQSYKRYGGRGITYDKRWDTFEIFLADMGERPVGTTLDRIDVDGNYTKNNCRWATVKEQSNNKSSNMYIKYNGKTLTATQWSEATGIDCRNIYWRIKKGWSIEKVLNTPTRAKRNAGIIQKASD